MNSWIIYVGVALIAFTAGVSVQSLRCDSEELERVLAENAAKQQAYDELEVKALEDHRRAAEFEARLGQLTAKKATIDVKNPVYTSCTVPADGLRNIQEAIRTANGE